MDIGSAFTFAFDDEDWIKKLAIGGGIALAAAILSPILVGLALLLPLYGYMLDVLKNVRDGQAKPLPEWEDFGGFFSKGLMVVVITIVYNIPALIFVCALVGANLASGQVDSGGAMIVIVGCLYCLISLLSALGNALIPAALIRYAQYDTLGSAFQFGEIFSFISSNIGDYVIVILLALVAGMIGTLGFILCGIGLFFTTFWSILVKANLYGQLARTIN